jgi:hypothetical protein
MVQRLDMFWIAKYNVLNTAVSLGNDRLFFITLRRVMFNDSIALVV